MPIQSKLIQDVVVTPLRRIGDGRGEVRHGLKADDRCFEGFGEIYFSVINLGVVKGWKRHKRMHSNLIVVDGLIRFLVYDDRSESSTNGQFMDIVCSIENYCRLTIPPGLWLAFQGLGSDTNVLLNFANIPHDPTEFDSLPISNDVMPWLPIQW